MKSLSINKPPTLEFSVPPHCCHPSLLKMNGSQAGQYAARWPKILPAVPIAGISSAFQTAADLCMINDEEQSAITHWPRPQMSNVRQDSSCAYQNKTKAKLHWKENFHLQEIIPLKATGEKNNLKCTFSPWFHTIECYSKHCDSLPSCTLTHDNLVAHTLLIQDYN